MPVILAVFSDPTEYVLQSEEMRDGALQQPVSIAAGLVQTLPVVVSDSLYTGASTPLVANEQLYTPMASDMQKTISDQQGLSFGFGLAAMCSPCGLTVPFDMNPHRCMMEDFGQGTEQWLITVQAQDTTGAIIVGARVVAFETGRIAKDGAPLVAEGITDGSGNVTLTVSANVAHLVVGYVSGSPDKGGTTSQILSPTQA